MTILIVKVNGNTVCRAGGDAAPEISVHVSNRFGPKEARISVSGDRPLERHANERVYWPDCDLAVGDEVSIVIESEGTVTPNYSTETHHQKPEEQMEQEFFNLVAKKRLGMGDRPWTKLSAKALAEAMAAPSDFCAFCGKYSDEVESMIAGPVVRICGECVEACSALIEAKKSGVE